MIKSILLILLLVSTTFCDMISNGIAINEHTLITTSHGVYGTDSGKTIVNGNPVPLSLVVQSKLDKKMIDLAIVTVPDSITLNACPISPLFVEHGDNVELYATLYNGNGFSPYTVHGDINDYDDKMPLDYVYSIKVQGREGLSGGPMIYNGNIIGMTIKFRSDTSITYTYTYDILTNYLEQADIHPNPNTHDIKKCVYPIIGYTQSKHIEYKD